jgi:hypothetical protein
MHTQKAEENISTMAALANGFHCDVDTVDEATWYGILDRFGDANIYQTWAYDEVRCGRNNISHLLLKKNGEVVAAAQSRLVKLPLLKIGIAYVRWGPLWRRKDIAADSEVFRQAVRALRNEYAFRRGLVLRLYPALFQDDSSCLASILSEEGYSLQPQQKPDRTIIVDVCRPLEEIRKGFRAHWQRNLKLGERSAQKIVEGGDDRVFSDFTKIYKEMVGRKKFAEPNDIAEFRSIQRRLPPQLKMKVILCKANDAVSSGIVCSAIGTNAIYLFGATSNAGLKSTGSSNLLQWRFIEELNKTGVKTYDLNGIDPAMNPGTYKFKSGMCGTNGKEVCFLGKFQSPGNLLSNACVAFGEGIRMMYGTLRKTVAKRGGTRAEQGTGGPIAAPCE